MKIKLAGMVTLYNPTNQDIKNIDSYINDIDILYIVDNTEGKSNKHKLPKSKKIKYIFNNENKGVGYALNYACELSIKNGYKYLLTMDQDSKFEKGALKKLKEVVEKEDMSKYSIVVPWHNTKLKMKKLTLGYDYPETTMTSGNILNLDVWQEVGGFEEDFFIDGIDIEYSFKTRKKGYKILRVNSVDMEHNLGDIKYKKIFNRDIVVSNHNYLRKYYIIRNNHYINDKYKDYSPYLCSSLVSFKRDLFTIIMYEKDKYKKIRSMIRGYKDYKKGIKGKYRYKK